MEDNEVAIEAPGTGLARVRQANALAPARSRWPWIVSGIAIQLVAVGVSVATVVLRAKREAVGGVALKATVLMAAKELAHTKAGLAVFLGCSVVFAVGCVLLARPFVRSVGMLFVAVPLAAIAGVLVLGALALVVALVVALAYIGFDGLDFSSGGSGSKKKQKATPQA